MESTSPTPREIRDIAVAWMNRGHELLLQGDAASLPAALDAYSEAIAKLRLLPLAENHAWSISLGAALMNRGQLIHRLHGVEQAAVALASFDEASVVLRALPADDSPWARRNLAGTLVNRANLLLDLGQFVAAGDTARDALILAAPLEREQPIEADLALKARRALGDSLGHLLVVPGADQESLAREASDLVEDALAVIRHWKQQEPMAFRGLSLRFFHYGAQLYRYHQPHFLAEFIEEHVSPADAELRTLALNTIDATLQDPPREKRILTIGDPRSERIRQTYQDLTALRSRLAA